MLYWLYWISLPDNVVKLDTLATFKKATENSPFSLRHVKRYCHRVPLHFLLWRYASFITVLYCIVMWHPCDQGHQHNGPIACIDVFFCLFSCCVDVEPYPVFTQYHYSLAHHVLHLLPEPRTLAVTMSL